MGCRTGWHTTVFILISLDCAGCSTVVPNLPDDDRLAVGSVVKGVQCEMKEAVIAAMREGRRPWLMNWEAAYAITLNVSETGSVRAVGGTPVATPNVIAGLSAGIGSAETRRRIAKLNFVSKLSQIQGYHCETFRGVRDHPFGVGNSLGRAGLSEWLNRALDAVDPLGPDDEVTPTARRPASVGHTFEFIVAVDANAGAGFALLPAGGATFGPSGMVGRTDDHSLEVTFAPPTTVVRTVRSTEKVFVPKRQPTPKEAKALADLDATAAQLNATLAAPDIQGLSPLEKSTSKAKLAAELVRIREDKARIEEGLKPRIQTRPVTKTVVETSPLGAQNALYQLQLERLLSLPRF